MPEFYDLLGINITFLVFSALIPLLLRIDYFFEELTRYVILKRDPTHVFKTKTGFINILKSKFKRRFKK